MNIEDYDWDRLQGLGFAEGTKDSLKSACWKGYEAFGMKTKGGRKVPNCVKVDSKHSEGDIVTAEMTPNYLPKEPIPGGGDKKNMEMTEQKMLMPRMEEINKKNAKNGHLSMTSSRDHSEVQDFHDAFHSMEPNAAMAINQLRVMREKIDIMLGMLYPDDNLEPWMSAKLTMSAQNLASVADYMRFGVEFTESLDFTTCERPNGSRYGTGGKCRKGSEVTRRDEEDVKRKNGQMIGTSPRNIAIDGLNELKKEAEDYKKKFAHRAKEEAIGNIMKLYDQRIAAQEKFVKEKFGDK
jgi:hypothetical protein